MHTDPNGMIGAEPLFGGDPLVRPANTIPNPVTRSLVQQLGDTLFPVPLPVSLSMMKATQIVQKISILRQTQDELKRAFKDDALNGGWRAALTHPLYLEAEKNIIELRESLKELI